MSGRDWAREAEEIVWTLAQRDGSWRPNERDDWMKFLDVQEDIATWSTALAVAFRAGLEQERESWLRSVESHAALWPETAKIVRAIRAVGALPVEEPRG